jgi:CRISPR-associated protein Cas1
MGYRIVEITKPSECHVSNGQLVVEQEEATFQIPIEDIEIVICIGAKIRFSTMGLGELNKAGIIVLGFGRKHEIETIIEPYFPNQRHSSILKIQINLSDDFKNQLWNKIIRQKIDNSSRNLAILGLDGVQEIRKFIPMVHDGDKDNIETQAAGLYFQFYHKGLNRRHEDPVNSALNYGYAIVRSYIIKALISTGFHCALGINHHNEYNSFNLVDDLIEPWRPMVDQLAYGIIGSDFNLSMKQRRELTGILHRSCKINDIVMKISTGIELMIDSFRNSVIENQAELIKLPVIIDFKKELP